MTETLSIVNDCTFLWCNSLTATGGFEQASFSDLIAAVEIPTTYQRKHDLPIFLPTTALAKTKEAVEKANAQTALILDLDENAPTACELKAQLDALGCTYLAYSTYSSTAELPRWRVVIPLLAPVTVERWLQSQRFLAAQFNADECCTRIQQVSFAPGVPANGEFEYLLDERQPLLDITSPQWLAHIGADREPQDVKSSPQLKPISNAGIDPFYATIKSCHSLPELLLQYGFKRVGDKFLAPESTSGQAGIELFDDLQSGLCHHSSCPLHNDGGRFDACDVLLHYRYAGDKATMLKAEGLALTPTLSADLAHNAPQQQKPHRDFAQILGGNQLAKLGESIAKEAQLPVNTAILITLGIASALSSAAYCLQYPNGQRLGGGLYLSAEQPPGVGKSWVVRTLIVPVQEAVAKLNSDWANCHDTTNDDSSTSVPRQLRMFLSNATPEAIEQQMLVPNSGFFSLASAEQGVTNLLLGTGNKDRCNDNDLLLKGFNGEWHSSARITRSGFEGYVHGTITVLAQDGTIDTILGQSNGLGIAERFLLFREPSLLGHRRFDLAEKQTRNIYLDRYYIAVNAITAQIGRLDSAQLNSLIPLAITEAGWAKVNAYRQQIEPHLADGQKYSHSILRGAFGKADMQIMKLAAVLHVYNEWMLKNTIAHSIDLQWIDAAIELTDALLSGLVGLLEDKGEIGKDAECDTVMKMIKHGKCYTEREIIKSRINVKPFKTYSNNRSEFVRQAVARCVANGDLIQLPSGSHGFIYRCP
ncbi:DUF3987 domain-containing protein [Ferrimonas senticii]|uniref:DUF3987 domain-containing protein n=1 Tax=Ferrimonas senticii TaxID=394566 RepID=UPI000414407A|nr:DUF3987 domain-containing protein [Ferrimonas senticii]